MNEFNLTPIENEGKRVLTTAQISESYETSTKTIADNFGNNRKRYIKGKHFYCLTGDELKVFKNQSENFGVVDKRASSLYLWTEKVRCFMRKVSIQTKLGKFTTSLLKTISECSSYRKTLTAI